MTHVCGLTVDHIEINRLHYKTILPMLLPPVMLKWRKLRIKVYTDLQSACVKQTLLNGIVYCGNLMIFEYWCKKNYENSN